MLFDDRSHQLLEFLDLLVVVFAELENELAFHDSTVVVLVEPLNSRRKFLASDRSSNFFLDLQGAIVSEIDLTLNAIDGVGNTFLSDVLDDVLLDLDNSLSICQLFLGFEKLVGELIENGAEIAARCLEIGIRVVGHWAGTCLLSPLHHATACGK